MPRVPLHQLDARIQIMVDDLDQAILSFPSLKARLDTLKVSSLLSGMKADLLEQRVYNTVLSLDEGGILQFTHGYDVSAVTYYLENTEETTATITLAIPPATNPAATELYVEIAGEYEIATGPVGHWGPIVTQVTLTVPPGGLVAGWGVLYR